MANKDHVEAVRRGPSAVSELRARRKVDGLELNGADLRGASVRGLDLSSSDLREADLSSADLRGTCLVDSTLARARLRGASMTDCNLTRASLADADLVESNLTGASLVGANLVGANLHRAGLARANLSDADLTRADLAGVRFTRTILFRAKVAEANFSGASFWETLLCDLDLSAASGLENAMHAGPSSLGLDTLVASSGKIPVSFLRGCGLQDWEVENAQLYQRGLSPNQITDLQYRVHELLSDPLLLRPLFVAYSHADSEFVDRVESALHDRGIRFWRDVHDLESGKLDTQIKTSLWSLEPVVLLVLSRDSVESDWVEWEAMQASKLEKQKGRNMLCPVAIDDSWKRSNWSTPLRRQIESYNVVDLSGWEEESAFQRQFGKVLRGIQRNYAAGD